MQKESIGEVQFAEECSLTIIGLCGNVIELHYVFTAALIAVKRLPTQCPTQEPTGSGFSIQGRIGPDRTGSDLIGPDRTGSDTGYQKHVFHRPDHAGSGWMDQDKSNDRAVSMKQLEIFKFCFIDFTGHNPIIK